VRDGVVGSGVGAVPRRRAEQTLEWVV